MKIDKLRVTQSGLRNTHQVPLMIKFVEDGGRFNQESLDAYHSSYPQSYCSPLIKIAKFSDGEEFIADGHHRIAAIKLGGRDFLYNDEFQVSKWTYDEYLDINFNQNWVTPFDPRKDFRYPDFLQFKCAVRDALKVSKTHAIDYIRSHPHLYLETKRYEDISTLAEEAGLIYQKVL